jgi:ATP-dependent Clp protease adapter protein ClpS
MAREMGHARVGESHVLLALLDAPPVQGRMARAAQSCVRLERRLRETLAAEWDGRTDRNGPEPALDPELEHALEKARAPGIGRFFRRPGVADVFDHLLARRGLAADIAFDEAPVRRLFDAAAHAMRSRKHWNLLIDHVFYALSAERGDDGRFARALARLGHPPNEVHAALHRELGTIGRRLSARVRPWPALLAKAAAHANAAGRAELDVDILVVEFLASPFARTCFGRIGVSRDELLRDYLSNAAAAAPSSAGAAEVVFHDDDVTTKELVTALVHAYFDKSFEEARAFMLRVHDEGQASLAMPDAKVARFLVDSALATCAELGVPLRIELRAIPVGGKGSDRPPSF